MSTFTRILNYLKPYRKGIVLATAFLTLTVGTDLLIPRLVQVIVDQGIAQKNMQLIINTGLIMIGASVVSALLMIVNTVFSVKTAQSFAADVRRAVYQKIQAFSFGNLDDFQTGQLLVRLTSDINQLQLIVLLSLRMLVRAPLMMMGSIFIMVTTNLQLTTTVLMIMPITLVLTVLFIRKAEPLFLRVQKKLDALNQVLQENLEGIRVVKAFVRRDFENKRFEKANEEYTEQSIKVTQLLSILFPMMSLLINLSTISVLYFGGFQVMGGDLSVGEVIAFINYLGSTVFPLLMLAMVSGQMSASNASARRIIEVIDAPIMVVDPPNPVPLTAVKGKVTFEDVSFNYIRDGREPVLQDINLIAEPGQTVAILGSTGSGKSSLIHLIPRFYDVTKGRVMIDDVDVRDVAQHSLRSHIGISLQETVLFSGTIRENIKFGRDTASDEEVIAVAKAAQAHEFIMRFPEGYDTMVGQRGVTLSGGQKQRVAIARALLIKPRILILDDSTSAVDVETESKIQKVLEELMKDSTSFIIAQRVSTVLNADKIVVMNAGKIVAQGTHHELQQTSQIYREIYDSQLGEGGNRHE